MATSGGNPFPPAPPPPGKPWPGDVATGSGGVDSGAGTWTVIVKRHRAGPSGLVALWAANTLVAACLATATLARVVSLTREEEEAIRQELADTQRDVDSIAKDLQKWGSR